ncbi:MAG: thrombospondin type 3 repeat-containing protein [Chitinophagales bacterium]
MKKIFFLLIAAGGALSAIAQAPDAKTQADTLKKDFSADNVLTKWVLDVNLLGGMLTQNLTTAVPGYTNAVNTNISALKFSNGMSYGADAQVGYFFSRNNNWGVGTGLMYLHQTGDVTMDKFKVEYQSTDSHGLTFRQVLTANQQVKEQLKITNINIPIVLKYKHRFTKRVGITADAGLLINLQNMSAYKTNASFDYEAIYQYATDVSGHQVAVYDYSPTPSSTGDLLVTQAQYLKTHQGGDVNAYMNMEHYQNGYNVGLGVKPNSNTGSVSYTAGSVGFIFQPSVNLYLNDKVALNFGLYYLYQPTMNNASSTYKLTDKMGDYTSMLKNVSSGNSASYGLNVGVRMYFGKVRDFDHDGIPDKKDWCPYDSGLVQFHGCPDADGDGIPDYADSCPHQAGLPQFNGCPDSDGDGIPDNEDACPYQAGPASNNGCPIDTDGDGVPDNEDQCPTVPGPASNHGCPLPPPPPPPPVPLHFEDVSTPILFELGKANIHESSFPILEEAVMEMGENESAFIIIDGHTDNIGSPASNTILSFKRANAVKTYLMQMGADAKRMIAVGHGQDVPLDTNATPEGRSHNRRVIMTIKNRRQK